MPTTLILIIVFSIIGGCCFIGAAIFGLCVFLTRKNSSVPTMNSTAQPYTGGAPAQPYASQVSYGAQPPGVPAQPYGGTNLQLNPIQQSPPQPGYSSYGPSAPPPPAYAQPVSSLVSPHLLCTIILHILSLSSPLGNHQCPSSDGCQAWPDNIRSQV